jgi:hypothetical protein
MMAVIHSESELFALITGLQFGYFHAYLPTIWVINDAPHNMKTMGKTLA